MMPRSPGVPRTAVRYARWGLPWICALVLSASLAYAMNTAVSGGPWARQTEMNIVAPQTTHGPLVPERPDTSLIAPTQPKGSDVRDGWDISCGQPPYESMKSLV